MAIIIHPHAAERLLERGVSKEEAIAAIEQGERFEAKYGRVGFRKSFAFNGEWRGKRYAGKQVEVYAVQENGDWVMITVIAKYF